MVDVQLAGFNVDKQGLDEIVMFLQKNRLSRKEKDHVIAVLKNASPETIAASYARISRDPREIPKLREDSRTDVEGARKSNKAIIFTMGHKSIAEHAVFNFDIMGLSRRAVEELEKFRLCSYTEKSQRYITLKGDFVLPKEIKGTRLEKKFISLINKQNQFYKKHLPVIQAWHQKQNYADLFKAYGCDGASKKRLEKQKEIKDGLGKEDTRYSLAMATETQIGMTISARNLEVMITRFRSSDVEEIKELGEKFYTLVDGIAPSVIKYIEPVNYFAKTRKELEAHVSELLDEKLDKIFSIDPRYTPQDKKTVSLYTKLNRDDAIVAGLIFSSSFLSYDHSLQLVTSVSDNKNDNEKIAILNKADKYQEKHDPKLREYELGDRIAEFTMSSSAFAQFKRHRMDTIISQRYSPLLSFTMPPSIFATGLDEEFNEIMNASGELYNKMMQVGVSRDVAEYALTNAHRRRVIFNANNRQAHAFCMERLNLPAQWDIRRLAEFYAKEVQKESPLTLRHLAGKHNFYEIKEKAQNELE